MKVEFDRLVIRNSKPIPKGRAGQVLIIGLIGSLYLPPYTRKSGCVLAEVF